MRIASAVLFSLALLYGAPASAGEKVEDRRPRLSGQARRLSSTKANEPSSVASKVRAWRIENESKIVQELSRFLAIPNVASDLPNIERNAQAIIDMFKTRGIEARALRMEGAPPIVVADIPGTSSRETVAFYAHYDGQPVDAGQWATPPWEPAIKPAGPITPESRIYARSASDDKSPIIALLAALDALRANGLAPSVNVKFVFEGEEEAGSPHLEQYMQKFAKDFAVDAWILCDGPVHQSRKMQVYFGARGVVDLELSVYGPRRALHSGHYGNWAPNPIVTMSHLVAGLRDTEGRILIDGFYDDVVAPSAVERDALARIPPFDAEIRRELALGRTEGGRSLNEQILLPALNLRGIAGGDTGSRTSNSIPTEATASIDFRLVPAQTPEGVRRHLEDHLTKQGFFIVREVPDAATLLSHPRVVRVAWGPGYPAARTAMNLPISKRVVTIVAGATGSDPITLPTLGGSIPMYLFQLGGRTPVIGVPIVNHDNNQHAANENIRLQNLWDGIEILAALFAGL